MAHVQTDTVEIAIIGAGPAGLMAAETLCNAGLRPVIFDGMPTPARKLLMAGKSGLNLTHSESTEPFIKKYGDASASIKPALSILPPHELRRWADSLGAETFVGTSGRVFPKVFKASPLLRAWLKQLEAMGCELRTRHKWIGWGTDGHLLFDTPEGGLTISSQATIFTLGGCSWPKLGADGSWSDLFQKKGIPLSKFKPANCGFNVNWSKHFSERFAGEPVKGVMLTVGDTSTKGDFVITKNGIEGSAVYTISRQLRDQLYSGHPAKLHIDLSPDRSLEQLEGRISAPRGKRSFSTFLKKTTGLSGVKAGLLRECAAHRIRIDTELAHAIKGLEVIVTSTRPIEEAISVAGGVDFSAMDENLMLKALPGTFCAGEMLNWEAPTGGYLLTACMAQGKQAALGAVKWLSCQ